MRNYKSYCRLQDTRVSRTFLRKGTTEQSAVGCVKLISFQLNARLKYPQRRKDKNHNYIISRYSPGWKGPRKLIWSSRNLMKRNSIMCLLGKMAGFTFELIDTSLGARKRELLR